MENKSNNFKQGTSTQKLEHFVRQLSQVGAAAWEQLESGQLPGEGELDLFSSDELAGQLLDDLETAVLTLLIRRSDNAASLLQRVIQVYGSECYRDGADVGKEWVRQNQVQTIQSLVCNREN